METWQADRSAFNHDWLQNRLLQMLGSALAFIRGEFREEGFPVAFATRLTEQWEAHRHQARGLAARFESEMSPSVLVGQSPFDRLDAPARIWLSAAVHESWLARRGVHSLVEEVVAADSEAEAAFLVVEGQLLRLMPITPAGELGPLLPALQALDRAVRSLSAAISRLPDQIEVT